MTHSSRFAVRFLGAVSLVAATMGCSLVSRTDNDVTAKRPAANSAGDETQFRLFKSPGSSAPSAASVTVKPGSAEFSTSSKLKDPVKVHLAYALWHEQEGNLVEARNSYNKVLDENSKNVDAMLGLARLDIAMSRMGDAERRLQKAHKLAPQNPQVSIALGQYFSARGDWTQALEHMKTARSLAPDDTACAYHLGFVQAKLGDVESALTNFTEAVGAAEAQYNLGYILYEQGEIAAAEERLQKAISLKPDLAQAQSLLITVRQRRLDSKTQLARNPFPRNVRDRDPGVQPASYTEVARPARSVDPAPFGN